jgi:hypothetical protein
MNGHNADTISDKISLVFSKKSEHFLSTTVKVGLLVATVTIFFIFLPDLFPFLRV